MLKNFIFLVIFLQSIIGCKKEVIEQKNIENTYSIKIDGRLPIDINGIYHLKLDSTKNQTIHTISGSLRVNNQIRSEEHTSELQSH